MTIFALTDVDIYLGNVELSCVSNSVSLETEAEEVDVTTFCSDGWKSVVGGLKSWKATVEGFVDYSFESATPGYDYSTDLTIFDKIDTRETGNLTFAPQGDSSTVVYFSNAKALTYSHGGSVGEAAAFTLDAAGTDAAGLLRGKFLATKSECTGTGVVPQYDHGTTISSDAKVYVSLHQLNASLEAGDTIKVFSSASVGFTSPVERFSFDAESLGTSDAVVSLTGVTHRYWRIDYDLTEPVTFIAAIAVV